MFALATFGIVGRTFCWLLSPCSALSCLCFCGDHFHLNETEWDRNVTIFLLVLYITQGIPLSSDEETDALNVTIGDDGSLCSNPPKNGEREYMYCKQCLIKHSALWTWTNLTSSLNRNMLLAGCKGELTPAMWKASAWVVLFLPVALVIAVVTKDNF